MSEEKTLIGALASHDSLVKNDALAKSIRQLWEEEKKRDLLNKFHFLFTKGTFRRVALGLDKVEGLEYKKGKNEGKKVKRQVDGVLVTKEDKGKEGTLAKWVLDNSTCLPGRRDGGVTVLANFVVNHQCRIIWPFLDPAEAHWLNQENLALMRLCDVLKVKRLMNKTSVEQWFNAEAEGDSRSNLQPIPPKLKFPGGGFIEAAKKDPDYEHWSIWYDVDNTTLEDPFKTIALIAHDDRKERMIKFVQDYEDELRTFKRILATGTTGREVMEACGGKLSVTSCASGPHGGDIQIATEILAGRCKNVIFFVDPLHPQAHEKDVWVVFGACMTRGDVRMLTNEVEAREWIRSNRTKNR